MTSRLSAIAPDLAGKLERQSSERLRRLAADIAIFAVHMTQLTDPKLALNPHALSAALGAVQEARFAVDDLDAVREVVSALSP